MLLSTQTDRVFPAYGEEDGIKLLAKAGFDALDYSMFWMSHDDHPMLALDPEKHAEHLKKCAADEGLTFNQAHAPFPCWRYGEEAYNAKMPERVKNAIRTAGVLGAKAVVVHPIAYTQGVPTAGAQAEEAERRQTEFNLNFYRSLEGLALEYGVKIALENMWGHDGRRGYIVPNVCSFGADLARYTDELNPKAFTVCLDLGHCGLIGENADHAIRVLGKDRLGALHVHDNDNKNDSHTIPYTFGCKMDWEAITTALGEIDYQGDFTYEADNFLLRLPKEIYGAAETYMANLGRLLISKIDAHRPKN